MLNKLFIGLIKFYKRHISSGLRSSCAYTPTCSSYALDAFKKFSFFHAFILVIYRLIRCNPFTAGGLDPVPDKKSDLVWLI